MPFEQNSLVWVKLEGYHGGQPSSRSPPQSPPFPKAATLQSSSCQTTFCEQRDPSGVVPYGVDPDGDQETADGGSRLPGSHSRHGHMLSAPVTEGEEGEEQEDGTAPQEEEEDGDEAAAVDGEDDEARRLRKEAKRQRKAEKKAAKEAKRALEAKQHKAAAASKNKSSKKRSRADDGDDDGGVDARVTDSFQKLSAKRDEAQARRQEVLESNSNYRKFDFAPSKRPATSTELLEVAEKIRQAQHLRDENAVLECLSQLTKVTVTLKQLKKTQIGVLVGSLLDGTYRTPSAGSSLAPVLVSATTRGVPQEFAGIGRAGACVRRLE